MLNRGDQRADIFRDEEDRLQFLNTLGQAGRKTDWQAHAHCLMRNHSHLVIETPRANLVDGMKWIARRLQMGSWTYVSNLLRGEGARGAEPASPNQQLLLHK
ncbi:MAG: hypothetical protein ACREIC_28445 [Limisphaerales bacterium]